MGRFIGAVARRGSRARARAGLRPARNPERPAAVAQVHASEALRRYIVAAEEVVNDVLVALRGVAVLPKAVASPGGHLAAVQGGARPAHV